MDKLCRKTVPIKIRTYPQSMYKFQGRYTDIIFRKNACKSRKEKTIIKLLKLNELLYNNNKIFKYIFI